MAGTIDRAVESALRRRVEHEELKALRESNPARAAASESSFRFRDQRPICHRRRFGSGSPEPQDVAHPPVW
jgi:hypothetical protein